MIRSRLFNPHTSEGFPDPLMGFATNGSGAIFISDNDNGVVNFDLTGTLITSDGMRYRFQTGGRCVSITDRNGNQILINRSSDPNTNHYETDYVDQLGRTTKVEINAPDPANSSVTLAVLVTVKGYQGATHYPIDDTLVLAAG